MINVYWLELAIGRINYVYEDEIRFEGAFYSIKQLQKLIMFHNLKQ